LAARFAPAIDGIARARHELEVARVGKRRRGNHAAHGAAGAEAPHERAGVDAVNRGNSRLFKPIRQPARGAMVRHDLRKLAHHEAGHARGRALDIFRRDAVISDLGGRHREDLPGVREIRQRFLVAAHRGVEDDFAHPFEIAKGSAKGTSVEDRPVLKGEAREFRRRHGARV
jgi:hypothetical protein